MTPYILIGGCITLSYQLIFDFLRHHEETNNDRPLYFDHLIATTLIGSATTGFTLGHPKYFFLGGFFSFMIVAPISWWLYKNAKMNANKRPSNIFYENSCT